MVNGIVPGPAAVQIVKDGFYPWRKSIEINEQLIQEFRSILLIPETLPGRLVFGTTTPATAGNVPQKIIPSPDDALLALAAKEKTRMVIHIIDAASGREIRMPLIFGINADIADIAWNNGGSSLMVKKVERGATSWEILPAAERSSVSLVDSKTSIPVFDGNKKITTLTRSIIQEVSWSPRSSDEFYLKAGNDLYLWDFSQNRAKKILENVHSFAVLGNNIFFATENGFLAESDLDGKSSISLDRPGAFIAEKPFQFLKNAEGQRAVIDSAGGLYLENTNTKKFVTINGGVAKARFAENADTLAYVKGSTINQILLADETKQPFRKKYEKAVILDAVTPINDFIWFSKDSMHLIFTTENGAFIAENDPRFGANATTLKTGKFLIAGSPASPDRFYLTDGQTLEEITIQ